MSKKSTLTIHEAFELFIRKCKIKNLTDLSISSYEKKMVHFYEFIDKNEPITTITSDTVDDYILWLRENTEANDITINSYLRSVRAFLYYCMECNYIPTFKIRLIKAEKKIKETYTDEELMRLLQKPDINNCSFSCYKTWVFENYLLGTGNRISTALDLHIGDINFQSGIIVLRKTKNRKQQIIPLSNTLADILQEYLQIRGGEDTPINIGTTFVLKGNPYVVISRDGDEGEVYYTSMAVKCDTSLTTYVNGEGYITVPFITISDKYTLQNGSTISLISGNANCYTGLNKYSQNIAINDTFYNYGGYYKVGNIFWNNGLCYIYMSREAMPNDSYTLTYDGDTTIDISTTSTYQLSYLALNNTSIVDIGFKQRFTMFKKILGMQGISVDDDVDVIYNVSMPVASTEMVANLKALQEMGAISRETIMEKTEYVSDVEVEKKRLKGEEKQLAKLDKDVANVPKDKEKPTGEVGKE